LPVSFLSVFASSISITRTYQKTTCNSLAGWQKMLASVDKGDTKRIKAINDIVKVYEREFDHFAKLSD